MKDPRIAIKVGRKVRRQRIFKGLTLAQLEKRSGVHFTSISKIENGHRQPGLYVLAKLSVGLGIRLEQLLA